MTLSSIATLWAWAFVCTWCSRVTFCIAEVLSRTMLSSFTFVSVVVCSSFCVFLRAMLRLSSPIWAVWSWPDMTFLSCWSSFRRAVSFWTWLSKWLTSSRRFSASTVRTRWLSRSSWCAFWTFSSEASVRSSCSVFRFSSIWFVRCSICRSLNCFCAVLRSSTSSVSSVSILSIFFLCTSRSFCSSLSTWRSSSHCRSSFCISRCWLECWSRSFLLLSASYSS
mmetsp:Transcript_43596/g.123385  ORF Transcript_43596/g.123385 Transcript_43596/m.123385 type:complete len:223 (+) Transcript_43596:1078-1746(+)